MTNFEKRQLQYGIGLTGSIACGKSTIGRFLASEGFLVIDADQISRDAVKPGSQSLKNIANYFGEEFILEDGNLDRSRMREHIFSDESAKKKLESFIHPEIARIYQEKVEASEMKYAYWFYEASLLVELNRQKSFFELWVADCPYDIQVKRLMARESIEKKFAMSMIEGQMSSSEKKKHASVVIDTNKSLHELEKEISELTLRFKKESTRG